VQVIINLDLQTMRLPWDMAEEWAEVSEAVSEEEPDEDLSTAIQWITKPA